MDFTQRSVRSHLPFSILLCILISLCIIWLRSTGALEFLELFFYDYYQIIRNIDASPDANIVLIKISEADIQRQGQWPLTDSMMADLLERIEGYNPAVVGLDIYRDIPVPPGSDQLKNVFSRHENIVTVNKVGDGTGSGIPQPYAVKDSGTVGFNDITVDPDGVIRRGLLFLDDGKTFSSSFSLLLAAYYLRTKGILPEPGETDPQYLKLGKTTFLPLKNNDGGYVTIDARGYQYLLDMRGAPFASYPLADLLAGIIPPDALSKKIVIIGVTAESLKDFFYTPLSRSSSHPVVYGIELHSFMTSQVIRSALDGSRPVASIREYYEWIWIALWGFLGAALGIRIRSVVRFFLLMVGSICLLVIITYATFHLSWWLPLIPSAMSCIASTILLTAFVSYRESADRKLLMQLFSKYVSEDVADAIWQQREQFILNGRLLPYKLVATVLFTDLKGFTTISERLDPQALMDWLNEYMDAMARIITLHGGVINKYMGDAIMAVFGVPFARRTDEEIGKDAVNAVNCALAMWREIENLNELWRRRDLPAASMRIGISTGPLIAGCLGSEQRMEYTVIGDTVNTASRLESFGTEERLVEADNTSCRILISEATLKYTDNEFVTKPVGKLSLKGKAEKIQVDIVMGKIRMQGVAGS